MRKILDYHDILLRKADTELLQGPHWLNDQVMSFYFEYLAREKYADTNFGFVGGCLASFLNNAGLEDALSCTQPLRLKEKDLILLPVNNSTDANTANSGSHWSLLVISTADEQYLHFDSANGVNKLPARLLAQKMQRLLDLDKQAELTAADFARQTNGYDCGMYAIGAADIICREKKRCSSWAEVSIVLKNELSPGKVSQLRKDLLRLIETKAG